MTGVQQPEPRDYRDQSYVGYLIGPLFIILMIWFLVGSETHVPSAPTAVVAASDFSTEPLRVSMDDPPWALMGGYELKCVECHKLFPSLPETPRRLTQHVHIKLDHGMNNRCFNCHDYENRNRLVKAGGETISFNEVALLCATCHGTTFRDWQRGMHGRTNGHWDPKYGAQERLLCSQCHDPHSPAFDPMSVLPGPNTLRMGDPNAEIHISAEEAHNPLRVPINLRHGSGYDEASTKHGDDPDPVNEEEAP